MTYLNVPLSSVVAPSFYDVVHDVFEEKYTHHFLKGGRGSTKSSFISLMVVIGIMNDAAANAIVIRKVKDTLSKSVVKQIAWAIEALKVSHLWDIPKSNLVITYKPTGQEIRFEGADDPIKLKSTKFIKGYPKYIWFEELDQFDSMEEIRTINQSLMRGGKRFLCFYSYNPPRSSNNWVNAEAKATRNDRLIHHSTYKTVPAEWLGDQFIIEAEYLRDSKLQSYEHEYLGLEVGTGGEVFDNVKIMPITDAEIAEFHNIRRGVDFGFAIDPFSYGVMHYDRKYKRLYIYHELYKVGLSNRSAWAHIAEENKNNEMVTADSAEPKSIHELRQYGLRMRAAKKGPDSIEYGVKFLQDLNEIIIDDQRCPETAREFLTYELEKDAHGNFKAGYPDKNNHAIDMVRYAMNDEAMQFKEHKKHVSDPDNPTPHEKQQKAIKAMTGRTNVSAFTKWG
ncbi:PBSX family phage terminase large subunit [Paenibacillus sp. Soil724D2]|uniref:PBSX family phage terminase large subunit n=1 Tax=Paenibacillus sp. (strain Soil724D2) TaxID=1736392 RepID=UPI0007C6762F|nr:PBSX family phage terminase large subunit [Paenibacillus sp. Soil724D2]